MFRSTVIILFLIFSSSTFAAVDFNRFIDARQNGAIYVFKWDGWTGRLYMLKPQRGRIWGNAYLLSNGNVYSARYWILNPAVNYLVDPTTRYYAKGPGYRGAGGGGGHRIVLHIDFKQTGLSNGGDNQGFDGYVFTQSMNAFAGVTWWNKIPFSFYARRLSSWDGNLETILPTP